MTISAIRHGNPARPIGLLRDLDNVSAVLVIPATRTDAVRQLHRFAVRAGRKTFCPELLVSPLPALQGRTMSSPWYRHAECFPFVSGVPARWLSAAQAKLSEPRSLEGSPGACRGLHIPNGEGFVKWKENLESGPHSTQSQIHNPQSAISNPQSPIRNLQSAISNPQSPPPHRCSGGPFSLSPEEVHSLPSGRNPYRAPPAVLGLERAGSGPPAGGASSSNSSSFRWMSGRSVNAA